MHDHLQAEQYQLKRWLVHLAAGSDDNKKAVHKDVQSAVQSNCVHSSIVKFGHSLLQSGCNNKGIIMPNGSTGKHLKPAEIRSLTAQLAT